MSKAPDANDYRKKLSEMLTHEIFSLIGLERSQYGDEFVEELTLDIIASMVGTLVIHSAMTSAKVDGKVRKKATGITHHKIQETIATGYMAANMHINPGDSDEFYCHIGKVPRNGSKVLN